MEAVTEEAVIGDAELGACFHKAEHGVAGNFSRFADGAARNFSLNITVVLW